MSLIEPNAMSQNVSVSTIVKNVENFIAWGVLDGENIMVFK